MLAAATAVLNSCIVHSSSSSACFVVLSRESPSAACIRGRVYKKKTTHSHVKTQKRGAFSRQAACSARTRACVRSSRFHEQDLAIRERDV